MPVTTQALFTEPLVEQLIALVYRDQLTYLALFNETEGFNEFSLTTIYPLNPPQIAIYDLQTLISGDHFETIPEDITLRVKFVVTANDKNLVSVKCRHYAAALFNLFWNLEINDNASAFYAPLPLPPSLAQIGSNTVGMQFPSMVNRLRVVAHRFSQFGQLQGMGFAMVAEMDLQVMMEESVGGAGQRP